jgi:tRNA A-37 threonylcarbamoyl transferase component Bud32
LRSIDKINKSLQDFFKLEPNDLQPLTEGTNNKVYKVRIGRDNLVVKSYAESVNSMERLFKEYNFLLLCHNNNINNVPKVKFIDKNLIMICETYISGTNISSSSYHIEAMIIFISSLNSNIPLYDVNFIATDAIFTSEELFKSVKGRISKVQSDSSSDKELKELFSEFFKLLVQDEKKNQSIKNFFDKFSRRVISPSDLGPENMLYSDKVFFIDFEYSGLDSNVKMALDLVTRPSINFEKFTNSQIEKLFLEVMGFEIDSIPFSLVQIFKLKWILIEYSSTMRREIEFSKNDLELRINNYNLAVMEMIKNFT